MNWLVVIKDSVFEHVLCPFLPSLPDGHPCHPHLKKRQLRNGEIFSSFLILCSWSGTDMVLRHRQSGSGARL